MLKLWKSGDEKAFEALYQRHHIRLVNLAYKKTGHLEASQELVQDVFLSLYRQLPTLAEHTVLEHYLHAAVRNRVYNYHRQQLLQQKKDAWLTRALPSETPEAHTLEVKELEHRLRQQIAALPPQCRAVFQLSREEQLSNKEIASKLSISVNTVEQHMRKALRILRSAFEDELWVVMLLLLIQLNLFICLHT